MVVEIPERQMGSLAAHRTRADVHQPMTHNDPTDLVGTGLPGSWLGSLHCRARHLPAGMSPLLLVMEMKTHLDLSAPGNGTGILGPLGLLRWRESGTSRDEDSHPEIRHAWLDPGGHAQAPDSPCAATVNQGMRSHCWDVQGA